MQLTEFLSPKNLVWMAQLLYILCFVPQILENYNRKSGAGLSDYFLLAYLNTYITLMFYIFCLGLPAAYSVMCPIQGVATLVLIAQRLYYNNSPDASFYKKIYLANLLLPLIFVPFALLYPNPIGHAFGWISFIIILLNQMPQVVKVIRTRSVAGFSYMFVLIVALAAGTELYSALALGLPMQTILSAARGLMYFVIFSALFIAYEK